MEKVSGAAKEEGNQARGELRKYLIYCRPYLGHFHLLEGKDRGDLETGPGPRTASPAREAFNKIALVVGPMGQTYVYVQLSRYLPGQYKNPGVGHNGREDKSDHNTGKNQAYHSAKISF